MWKSWSTFHPADPGGADDINTYAFRDIQPSRELREASSLPHTSKVWSEDGGRESHLLRQNLITPGAQELLQGMITSHSHYIKLLFLMNQRKQAYRAGLCPRVMEHTCLLWDNIYRCCPILSISLCHRCLVLLGGMTKPATN